ncbi:hypothetical protein M2302_000249 [Micromonospora sp. A200]|uniref:hypothetical protein n=1 Tax=Micromonospora sp. A200 TaxID=2940568 RepID=UPI002474E323|nr:hypothetical protein [Micromonospora sp. A200]MDH6460098.1 hypothetical protein [Micromonospora sp. A200]
MPIINYTAQAAQPTTRFKLEERTTRDGKVECTGIETGYDRTSGLRRFDAKIRQNPNRYGGRRRLVLVESDGGDR